MAISSVQNCYWIYGTSGKHIREMCTTLKPTYIIENLGFAGVKLIFAFFDPKHTLWVLVRI